MTYTSVWGQMISRCFDTEHPSYKNYGGRGIRVCDRWLIHRLFIEDMGPKPKGMSLNRIDNDGNYEPGNCEWASDYVQNRNKRNNRRITFNGETLCVSEWAEKIGMKMTSLTRRLNSGWSVEDALTKPINLKNSRPYKGKRAVNTAIDTNVEVKTPAADTDKVREADAWMTEDGERVVTNRTMEGARRDGGAMLSSMAPYSVALVRARSMAAQAPVREANAKRWNKLISADNSTILHFYNTRPDLRTAFVDALPAAPVQQEGDRG